MRDIKGNLTLPSYDYVVIGSGSAGSVMAARLAEDPATRVLLLEAGPADDSLTIRMPAALGFPLMNDKFNWSLHGDPEPALDGRRVHEHRGRVLGGSSSINGMNWVRGNPWDYDQWAAMGLEGWSYADVLPYFRKAESFDRGASDYRGGSGPMHIETCRADNPLYRAFLDAGVQAGYERMDDHNAYRQEGVHVTQRNVHDGLRWSTSRGYLHAKGIPPNLHVCTRARVTRLEFAGRRVVRVHVAAPGGAEVIEVQREAHLCAGAIHSPQLLMLSGLGDADALRALGLGVVQHLPGVGQGLKDHTAAPVQYEATQPVSYARHLSGLINRGKLGAEWLFLKTGLGATNFFEVGAFIRSSAEVEVPDVQFEFIPMLGDLQHGSVKLGNGFQYFFSLMRPTSTGRVWIDTPDPGAPPRFVFNHLATRDDQTLAVAAVRAIRHVVGQAAWSPYRGKELDPGASARTDAEILAVLRQTAGTNYHPCCTCRMGTDDAAVTDADARVHGTDNLRVIDASIMPAIVSGNLNAPVIMMAEKLADQVRGKAPLARSEAAYYRARAAAAEREVAAHV